MLGKDKEGEAFVSYVEIRMCNNKGFGRRVWRKTDIPIGVEYEQTEIEKVRQLNRHSCKEEASELNRQR
jgi:hypothetical protein